MAESIAEMARDFSLWLNSTYPPNLDAEAVHWRRVLKVAEEAGEVREAMGAWVHENPRKPGGPVEDVIKELADCVGAALGAIEHLTGHEGRSLDIASQRVRLVCERVGVRPTLDPHVISPGAFIETGPERWPFGLASAAALVARVAWPMERDSCQAEWSGRLVDEPNIRAATVRQARDRFDSAVAALDGGAL